MHKLFRGIELLVSIIGKVPTVSEIKSQHAKQWQELYAGINEAARFLNFKTEGAVTGQGMRKVPAINGNPGQGLLLF